MYEFYRMPQLWLEIKLLNCVKRKILQRFASIVVVINITEGFRYNSITFIKILHL